MEPGKSYNLVRSTIWLALFLLPICYISIILSVAIHEITGHGLAAIALGGRFEGFVIEWDAMGWANSYLPEGASVTAEIIHLAAGIIATTIAGLIFLVIAYLVRRKVVVRLCMLILSFICLMDGISYTLWNSYHPVTPGDIGTIIEWLSIAAPLYAMILRFMLLAVSVILFWVVTLLLCALIFQGIEQALLGGDRLSPRARLWILFLFLVVPGGATYYIFDWNDVIPGIGLLPCIVGVVSFIVSAIILYGYSLRPNPDMPGLTTAWYHILISWGSLFVTIILIVFWFQNGISLG